MIHFVLHDAHDTVAVVVVEGVKAGTDMATPEIAERAKTQGFRVDARGPKDFAVFLKSEVERWGKVIVAAKITAE